MPRNFPDWLKAYMAYTEFSESPTQFHFWTAVATVAGALQRHVWIEQPDYQYTPNFYIILVGPPGVAAKSTSMGIGMNMLAQVPGVHFGPESFTWQALGTALEEVTDIIRVDPKDETKKLQVSCLTIAASELGTLLKLKDTELSSVLIRMWDGQRELRPYVHKTRTQKDISVYNPWLNIIGATTPAWLQENFPESMIGGGLTSRIIFVYGNKKRQLIAYPSRHVQIAAHRDDEKRLVDDLIQISELRGEFELPPATLDWGEAWYERLWTVRPPHLASSRYDGYVARKQVLLHKVAMVVSVSQRDDLVITPDDMALADTIITSAEPAMIKVFESIGGSDQARRITEISHFLAAEGTLTTGQLWKRLYQVMSWEEFSAAILAGVEANIFVKTRVRDRASNTLISAMQLREHPNG